MNIFKRGLRSFLWRSGIGRYMAERFWKIKSNGEGIRYLFYNKQRVIDDLPINFNEEIFNKFLKSSLHNWEIQDGIEYVAEIDNVLIEPERCLGTQGFNQLVEPTVVFKAHYQYPYILPHIINKNRAKKLKSAVLYDGSATRNLYHHLIETVCRLSLLDKVNISNDIPIIVNRFVYDHPFFQYLFQNSADFRAYNWYILEKNDWLQVEKLFRPKALYFAKSSWDFTRRMYNLQTKIPFRKVFLSRDKKMFSRSISNEKEVHKMLSKYGFEIAYAEHLTMEQQISLFQETEYLVALHGMGLIQQFFMNYDRAHIIEVIPVNRLMPEYYCQAYSLGIKYYDVVLGDDVDGLPLNVVGHKRYENLKEYEVNIVKLEQAVLNMLVAPADQKVYGNCYVPFSK